jgi:hypothetical protein
MTTRTIQFGFVLALLGSQLAHGQSSLAINGIKAVWRSGNAFSYDTANCLSRGAYLTNICKDPQTVTFLTDLNTLNKWVSALVFSDAGVNAGLQCRATSQSPTTGAYDAGQFLTNSGPAPSTIVLPFVTQTHQMYQVDCILPPGVKLFGVEINIL